MDTAIIVILANDASASLLNEFKEFTKTYLGTSRYEKENDDATEGYQNGIVIEGNLSKKEKKTLMDWDEKAFIIFVEGEGFSEEDHTIKLDKDE